MNAYLLLLLAIAAEVAATIALRMSDGLTKLVPGIIVFIGYGLAFYMLSIAVKTVPLSISYSLWAGLGTAGAVVAGVFLFNENLNLWQFAGIIVIILGVFLLNFAGK